MSQISFPLWFLRVSIQPGSSCDMMIAFGGRGARVNTLVDLRAALTEALESREPTCINVSTNNVGLAPEIPLLNA